jgi:hypothetical protein
MADNGDQRQRDHDGEGQQQPIKRFMTPPPQATQDGPNKDLNTGITGRPASEKLADAGCPAGEIGNAGSRVNPFARPHRMRCSRVRGWRRAPK